MISSFLWLPIVVISANIFLFLKKNSYINYVIGIFIIWPLVFLLGTYLFNDYKIVYVLYFLSLLSGLLVIVKKRLFIHVILLFAIFFSISLLFKMQFLNFWGEIDSKHYTYSAARLNYNQWGNKYDNKIKDSRLINDLAKYTRLPMISYPWSNNIYGIPIKVTQIYGLSFLFSFFCIFFLSLILDKILSLDNKGNNIVKYVILFLISTAIYGGYSLLSSSYAQINQSYALLMSFITIYLSTNGSFNKELKVIIPILVFFGCPEFFPVYTIYLAFTLAKNNSFDGFLKGVFSLVKSLIPLILLIMIKYEFYSWYLVHQVRALPGWWPIVNYDKNIWLSYLLTENPYINNHALLWSFFFSIIIIFTNKIKLKHDSNIIYYLLILFAIIATYILVNITPNPTYASFKSSAWLFPLITICVLSLRDKLKFGYYILAIFLIFKMTSFSETYVSILRNKNYLKVNYSKLDTSKGKKRLVLNADKIDQMLSVASYNCPSRNCQIINKSSYSTKYR